MSTRNPALVLFLLLASSLAGNAQSDTDTHTVAPEMAGKWCYIPRSAHTLESLTNSCITLNADGTYDLQLDRSIMVDGAVLPGTKSSDAGKWWVAGNRLFYNSDSEGNGSFRFQKANHPSIENTPVLIVDGIIFCTESPRDPW